ncbi:hypothetical protein DL546_009785 [Coniochaeta pulveracea]|uniref:YTH domain-containing protein n=1 Tax=Coniochaeta pulveracea TaxID=177199 RepID=A0A420YN05_9PEZI|nr:hypothetical protein DL546_009785 [Coniochaeta pulveracea]
MGGSKAFPDPKVQAAELKKRLLRNKGQGNSTSTNTSTTARISPATDTSPKSHPAPQSQPQPQFRAESAEIDALIKAHSNPDQPNRNTSSADHEPSDTTSEMLAQKGEFTADKPSTMLGRLGKYAITNGDTTQVTDELSGALVNKNTTAVINQLEDDDANDLHEWLNLTGFYDRQARKKKLERSRKLAQFEAEERRIRIESARVKADQERLELERRKLMDEDGDEALPTPPLAQTPQATSKTCTRATDLQQQSEEGPATKLPDEQASLPAVPADAPQKGENGKKDGTKDEAAARDKHVDMMDRNTDTRAPRPSSRAGHNDMGMHHGRDLSRRSASPSFGCDGLGYDNNEEGYERNYGHNSYRDNTSGEHRGGSNHRGTDWYRMPSPHHGAMAYPKHVDLGGRGETRFFIVKSFTHDNVKQCMEDGTWATHRQHEKLFSDAFLHCKNVILVFSVNQSRAFQGYVSIVHVSVRYCSDRPLILTYGRPE